MALRVVKMAMATQSYNNRNQQPVNAIRLSAHSGE